MQVKGKHYQAIWLKKEDPRIVQIIDQRALPHEFIVEDLQTLEETARAIKEMHVRGAPLIGGTAAYGMYLALLAMKDLATLDLDLENAAQQLKATRPTAVDLEWAVNEQLKAIKKGKSIEDKTRIALQKAQDICAESVAHCANIGHYGMEIIKSVSQRKNGAPVNILTHCNAGWLACIDHGTATAPMYAAHHAGIPIHVWVDETRPRNQGARLTAWELLEEGVPHTIIADNVGGHLMQHGLVDLVIVGSDRTTVTGDVANKIGTYLKALAAKDNNVPFYVALPSTSFDWNIKDGIKEIPIEQRDAEEVKYIQGLVNGQVEKVLLTPEESPAANYAFDVTPAHLVSGLITERGMCAANEDAILDLFPEKKR